MTPVLKPALAALCASLVFLIAPASADADRPKMVHLQPSVADLVAQLQDGGHVLFVRHERTDATVPDAKGFDIAVCASQRNLSVAGAANAAENADVIKMLDIPIDRVEASPMCRTQDTARLMFGDFEVNPALAGPFGGQTDMAKIKGDITALVADAAGGAGNVALVSHIGVYRMAFGGHISEGDMAIFTMDGDTPELLGIIPANGWNDAMIDATLGSRDSYVTQ